MNKTIIAVIPALLIIMVAALVSGNYYGAAYPGVLAICLAGYELYRRQKK